MAAQLRGRRRRATTTPVYGNGQAAMMTTTTGWSTPASSTSSTSTSSSLKASSSTSPASSSTSPPLVRSTTASPSRRKHHQRRERKCQLQCGSTTECTGEKTSMPASTVATPSKTATSTGGSTSTPASTVATPSKTATSTGGSTSTPASTVATPSKTATSTTAPSSSPPPSPSTCPPRHTRFSSSALLGSDDDPYVDAYARDALNGKYYGAIGEQTRGASGLVEHCESVGAIGQDSSISSASLDPKITSAMSSFDLSISSLTLDSDANTATDLLQHSDDTRQDIVWHDGDWNGLDSVKRHAASTPPMSLHATKSQQVMSTTRGPLPPAKLPSSPGPQTSFLPLLDNKDDGANPFFTTFASKADDEGAIPFCKTFSSKVDDEGANPFSKAFASRADDEGTNPMFKAFISTGDDAEASPVFKAFASKGAEAGTNPNFRAGADSIASAISTTATVEPSPSPSPWNALPRTSTPFVPAPHTRAHTTDWIDTSAEWASVDASSSSADASAIMSSPFPFDWTWKQGAAAAATIKDASGPSSVSRSAPLASPVHELASRVAGGERSSFLLPAPEHLHALSQEHLLAAQNAELEARLLMKANENKHLMEHCTTLTHQLQSLKTALKGAIPVDAERQQQQTNNTLIDLVAVTTAAVGNASTTASALSPSLKYVGESLFDSIHSDDGGVSSIGIPHQRPTVGGGTLTPTSSRTGRSCSPHASLRASTQNSSTESLRAQLQLQSQSHPHSHSSPAMSPQRHLPSPLSLRPASVAGGCGGNGGGFTASMIPSGSTATTAPPHLNPFTVQQHAPSTAPRTPVSPTWPWPQSQPQPQHSQNALSQPHHVALHSRAPPFVPTSPRASTFGASSRGKSAMGCAYPDDEACVDTFNALGDVRADGGGAALASSYANAASAAANDCTYATQQHHYQQLQRLAAAATATPTLPSGRDLMLGSPVLAAPPKTAYPYRSVPAPIPAPFAAGNNGYGQGAIHHASHHAHSPSSSSSSSRNSHALLSSLSPDALVAQALTGRSQEGSIILQQQLKSGTADRQGAILRALAPHLAVLSEDKHGNFLVQRAIGVDGRLAWELKGSFARLALSQYGCHVVQRVLDEDESIRMQVVEELLQQSANLVDALTSRNSVHVWAKALETKWSSEAFRRRVYETINAAMKGRWAAIAMQETGSIVVQNLFESAVDDDEKRDCVEEILERFAECVVSQWGVWVAQHIIEYGSDDDRQVAFEKLLGDAAQLSLSQYGQKAVMTALKTRDEAFMRGYVDRLCGSAGGSSSTSCGAPSPAAALDAPTASDGAMVPYSPHRQHAVAGRRSMLVDVASTPQGLQILTQLLTTVKRAERERIIAAVRKNSVFLKGSKTGLKVHQMCERARAFTGY